MASTNDKKRVPLSLTPTLEAEKHSLRMTYLLYGHLQTQATLIETVISPITDTCQYENYDNTSHTLVHSQTLELPQ